MDLSRDKDRFLLSCEHDGSQNEGDRRHPDEYEDPWPSQQVDRGCHDCKPC